MLIILYVLLETLLFITGISLFSFINVIIYRLPKHLSFVTGRSVCTTCGHKLAVWDLIPIFSYLFLRGRCRYCGSKISGRYILIELLGGFTSLLCFYEFGYSFKSLLSLAFACVLTAVAFIDIDTLEIPNSLVIAVLIVGIIFSIFDMLTKNELSIFDRLFGIIAGSIPILLITCMIHGAFGGGDIKLLAAAGVMLGWKQVLVALFIGIILGGINGIWLLVSKKKGRKDHFAFGPFLCIGMMTSIFWGDKILNWYLSFFQFF